MFRRKKNNVDKCKVHSSLGEIRYVGTGWEQTEKIKVTLCSKIYEISLCFIAKTVEEDINEKQLYSIEKLNNFAIEQKSQIENEIMKCFECENEEELNNRFVPEEILISQNGECALFYKDADEEECDDLGEGFAMFLLPKLISHYPEDCLDCILGHRIHLLRKNFMEVTYER